MGTRAVILSAVLLLAASFTVNADPTATEKPNLSPEDKLEVNTVKALTEEFISTKDDAERAQILEKLLDHTGLFLKKHPDSLPFWTRRAEAAVLLNRKEVGVEAGANLKRLGALKSDDDVVSSLMGKLNAKGWLDASAPEASAPAAAAPEANSKNALIAELEKRAAQTDTNSPPSTADKIGGKEGEPSDGDITATYTAIGEVQQLQDHFAGVKTWKQEDRDKELPSILEQSGNLTKRKFLSGYVPLWTLRADAALLLDKKAEGVEAGQKMKELGSGDDPKEYAVVMAKLKAKGWLDPDHSK